MGCYSYIEHNKLSSEDHDETHQLASLFKKERRITTKRKEGKKNNILEELRKEYFTPIRESVNE